MTEKSRRGGARPGGGRKPLGPGEQTVSFPVKMTETQRDKLKRLGGAPWVRRKIDDEPEPPKKE